MRTARLLVLGLGVTIAIALLLSGAFLHLLTESWWFDATGFASVFQTRLVWRVGLWVAGATVSGLFLWGNYLLADRLTRHRRFQFLKGNLEWGEYAHLFPGAIAALLSAVLALTGGAIAQGYWNIALKSQNAVPYGILDPIFQRDLSFYVFQLPFLEALQHEIWRLLLQGLVMAVAVYVLKGALEVSGDRAPTISGQPKVHLALLLAALSLSVGWGIWLQRYELLYSPTGVVFGAGYADINARLPVDNVMTVVAAIVGAT